MRLKQLSRSLLLQEHIVFTLFLYYSFVLWFHPALLWNYHQDSNVGIAVLRNIEILSEQDAPATVGQLVPCPAGYYSNNANDLSCSVCAPGEYILLRWIDLTMHRNHFIRSWKHRVLTVWTESI